MTALRIAILLIAFSLGCGAGTRSPIGAVRAFAEAAEAGDRDSVYRLLGPETRHRLRQAAERAALLSGRKAVLPQEMLAVGWFRPQYHVDQVRERSRYQNRALVEVEGPKGQRDEVSCVLEGSEWRVELP